MNLQTCYQALGGNYEDALGRLRSERLVQRFVHKFPEDKSYALLCSSLEEADYETAFRAAHTLKGVCQNLSFTRLYESSHALTESLRGGAATDATAALAQQVSVDYRQTVAAISALDT